MMDVDISRNRLCKHVECCAKKDHASMNATQVNGAFDKSKIKHSSNKSKCIDHDIKVEKCV